jgi:hypothetical protein
MNLGYRTGNKTNKDMLKKKQQLRDYRLCKFDEQEELIISL